MEEIILPPSPNWFQVSGMAVSKDGWMAYGGPSKSLCLLEPLPADRGGVFRGPRYRAHVFNRVHTEKIVSVDISPDWPAKRTLLTGSADGSVKHWSLEKLLQSNKVKPTISHEIHSEEKEEIAGVGYSSEVFAVTVGCYGNVVKWDLNSNIAKTYSQVKNFKPLCMACSPHIPLQVAIGTKQGVVFVLDLNDKGKILYKVRGQDDEIVNISWCPQFELALNKSLKESEKRVNTATKDRENKKQKESVKEQLDKSGLEKNLPEDSFDATVSEDVVVSDDDMFDIYADHAADEFGHKKFQPEEITVRIQVEEKKDDYLADCVKLKEEILKRKTQGENSIQSLVDALDNTHVDSKKGSCDDESKESQDSSKSPSKPSDVQDTGCVKKVESSAHIHRHLLATIGKHGGVRIWSKSGKLVGSCVVPCHHTVKNQKTKLPYWPTLLWLKPDALLIADGKSQLLECNPLKIDCKNKLDWSIVHMLHKRGLYCIASNAPRVQTGKESSENWNVYTASQDRNIIQYSMEKKETLAVQSTSGGFIYTVLPCPYDAGKIAISVGDGAVRVWETSTLEDDDAKLAAGQVTSYWQNVQGKVLTIAWHPTRENLLAFATAESRIGLLDVSGKSEKPAKVLISALSGPIYSISWGEGYDLYACANGDLVKYHANKADEAPGVVCVEAEGRRWQTSAARWQARGLALGSGAGAVAVLAPRPPHAVLAATLVFSKLIHTVEWHQQQTSSTGEESPCKNLIAVCSCERHGNIVILEYVDKEDGGKQLQTYKTLSGHKLSVLQVTWNPHQDGQLLSTSQDFTIRIWDAVQGVCLSIFGGHSASSLGAAWLAYPQLSTKVVSGGSDCALRLWDSNDHPADAFDDGKLECIKKDRRKNKTEQNTKKDNAKENQVESQVDPLDRVATKTHMHTTYKGPKKFLLPMLNRPKDKEWLLHAARIMFHKYLEKTPSNNELKEKIYSQIESKQKVFTERTQEKASDSSQDDELSIEEENHYNFEYLKIFGSNKEINEILDKQMDQHKMSNPENWIVLAIFRGHIDAMIKFASERDMLCPYLVSIAPCVSYKYWKDVVQLYLAQIDRLMAKTEDKKIEEHRSFGGAVWRKAALLLSAHDARAAAQALADARLFPEAYLLCRTRYMDSIADEILARWAFERANSGLYVDAAVCYLALGNLTEAATVLGRLNVEECLNLAGDIAKVTGQNMLAEHIIEKRENMITHSSKTEEILEQLPSRIELLMKEGNNGESNIIIGDPVNGNVTKESS